MPQCAGVSSSRWPFFQNMFGQKPLQERSTSLGLVVKLEVLHCMTHTLAFSLQLCPIEFPPLRVSSVKILQN
jgi:hypothetical protein